MRRGVDVIERSVALSDVIALLKPRILLFAVVTAAAGAAIAPHALPAVTWLAAMLGTGVIVGSASTFNMYLERDLDAQMLRTRDRPLPSGRMDPRFAFWLGTTLGVVSLPILALGVNLLTAALGLVALVIYIGLYTPLKRATTLSMPVGAVAGAMPSLMGWTAATGSIDLQGAALFALVLLWQYPHTYAIALAHFGDYEHGGVRTLASERGERVTRIAIVVTLVAQVAVSFALVPLRAVSGWYLPVAAVAGVGYLLHGLRGLRADADRRWARGLFLRSLLYLLVISATLVLTGGAAAT